MGEVRVGARPRPRAATLQDWERLTASWIRQVPPDTDAAEVTARRILNWIYAWQRLTPVRRPRGAAARAASPSRSPTCARTSRRSATTARSSCTRCSSPRSRCPSSTATACSTSPSPSSTATCAPTSAPTACTARPRRTTTRSRCGRSSARARTRAATGSSCRPGFDDRLARACAFAAHCTRPDGTIPALSDADRGDYGRLLVQAADLLGDEGLRFVGTRGREGRAPARSATRASRTAATSCSAAAGARRARFLIFDCGPLGDGGHGHYDALSVEAHGNGRPLVVDPGRGSYSEAPPNLRRWFRGTAAHNTVCVDGLDQTPYTRGRPLGPVAQARFLGRGSSPGLDLLAGEVASPAYEAVHERRIAFVGRPLLADRGSPARRARAPLRPALASRAGGAGRRTARRARRAPLARHGAGARPRARDPRRRARRARARLGRAELRRAVRGAGRQRRGRRARARASSRCSRRTPPASRRRGSRATRPGALRVEIDGARDTIDLRATGCDWERAGGA